MNKRYSGLRKVRPKDESMLAKFVTTDFSNELKEIDVHHHQHPHSSTPEERELHSGGNNSRRLLWVKDLLFSTSSNQAIKQYKQETISRNILNDRHSKEIDAEIKASADSIDNLCYAQFPTSHDKLHVDTYSPTNYEQANSKLKGLTNSTTAAAAAESEYSSSSSSIDYVNLNLSESFDSVLPKPILLDVKKRKKHKNTTTTSNTTRMPIPVVDDCVYQDRYGLLPDELLENFAISQSIEKYNSGTTADTTPALKKQEIRGNHTSSTTAGVDQHESHSIYENIPPYLLAATFSSKSVGETTHTDNNNNIKQSKPPRPKSVYNVSTYRSTQAHHWKTELRGGVGFMDDEEPIYDNITTTSHSNSGGLLYT